MHHFLYTDILCLPFLTPFDKTWWPNLPTSHGYSWQIIRCADCHWLSLTVNNCYWRLKIRIFLWYINLLCIFWKLVKQLVPLRESIFAGIIFTVYSFFLTNLRKLTSVFRFDDFSYCMKSCFWSIHDHHRQNFREHIVFLECSYVKVGT